MRSGAISFVVLLCALLLSACHKDPVAQLKDGAKLRAEVLKLMGLPEGDVPKTSWTAPIKELKPLAVTREKDNVKILLAHERGKFSVGYHIYPDGQHRPSTQGVWVEKTAFEGIYIYKTQY
jgi:hypothetical protein